MYAYYALKPGVLEMIDDMRINTKTLEESISKGTTENSVSQEELVEKLKNMRTFIEAADSLSIIETDMKVIEEGISSGQNKEIHTSARKVYKEFAECKGLIEQQLNLLVDTEDDATSG